MAAIPKVVIDVVNAARIFVRAHNHFERIVEGEAPEQARKAAREQLTQAVKQVKGAVVAFERALEQHKKGGGGKARGRIPWGDIARGALKVGSAINTALEAVEGRGGAAGAGGPVPGIEGEVVSPGKKT